MFLDSSPRRERLFLRMGAVSGFVSVALGAFGAHALRETLSPERLAVFETGVRYQMIHALALIVAGMVAPRRPGPWAPGAGWLFLLGTFLFSGSLYLLALTGARAWGALTPAGGLAWLAAWAALAMAGARRRTTVVELVEEGEEVIRGPEGDSKPAGTGVAPGGTSAPTPDG